jgi:GTP cyclohydrolase II
MSTIPYSFVPVRAAASLEILEVERAANDLRRGESVLIVLENEQTIGVASAEYLPGQPFITDSTHPAVKLMKIAGLLPQAVLSQETPEAGHFRVSERAIADYPQALATSLVKVSEAHVPLSVTDRARVIAFRPRFGHEEHLAVVIGDAEKTDAPYVRLHSSCVTGDMFGSLRCDCGDQLKRALETLAERQAGVLLYLSQEGRGIGIANKLRAYCLQDEGMDTVQANLALGFEADERNFALAAAMLRQLGIFRITLLTNNPLKQTMLEQAGIEVAARASLVIEANRHNEGYLATKAAKMGHHFSEGALPLGTKG